MLTEITGGGHFLVRMEWRPAGWSVCLPLLIFPCTVKERKGRVFIIAPFRTKVHTNRSGMDHTVLHANNIMPAFPSWRSPDVTTTATDAADIQLQLTTHLLTPKG